MKLNEAHTSFAPPTRPDSIARTPRSPFNAMALSACAAAAMIASTLSLFLPASAQADEQPKACSSVTSPCTFEDTAVEYRQTATGVHFFTACKEEKAALDAPNVPFVRTGRNFPMWPTADASGVATAPSSLSRYFITVSASEAARHFQSALSSEKNFLDSLTQTADSAYCIERSNSGYAIAPPGIASLPIDQLTITTVQATAACPAGSRPVWRMYNDRVSAPAGKVISPQHRFTDSWLELQQTLGLNTSAQPTESATANWLAEGVRFCVPGDAQRLSLTIDPPSLYPSELTALNAKYAMRFQLRNDAAAGTPPLNAQVALQLPPGIAYQSVGAGATCTADPVTTDGQRVVCLGTALAAGGTSTFTVNSTASPAPTTPLTVSGVAIGTASATPTADQTKQLWPRACTAKRLPAYGCDKATAQGVADTVLQAAAKLSFDGTLDATVTTLSSSSSRVTLTGLNLRAGSSTPVKLELYVEYQGGGSTTWQVVPAANVTWSPAAQANTFATPDAMTNLAVTVNYPSSLPNPNVTLRVCARVIDDFNAFDGGGACTGKSVNAGFTAVSSSKVVNVGTLSSSASPVLSISSLSTQTVTPGVSLPSFLFFVARQSNSTPPSGDLACTLAQPVLGYSCAASGSLLGSSTSAYCACSSNQTAPSSGTYTLYVSASAQGATSSGAASGSIQVYAPPVVSDYSKLTWTNLQVTRNAQNVITFTGKLRNGGTADLDTLIRLYATTAQTGPLSGASVTAPAGGRLTVQAGTELDVTATAPAATAANTSLFLCAVKIDAFNSAPDACNQANEGGATTSSSAALPAPATQSAYWAVRALRQTDVNAAPVAVDSIDLSTLTSGQNTSSAWLFGCSQQQSGGGTPPDCQVSMAVAGQSTRQLPANPLTLGTDYALYFKGADSNGNLTVCRGKPWEDAATPCANPVWPGEALPIDAITVTIGTTTTKTVMISRNIPPPAPVLTVTAPTPPTISSGGTLPTLTFGVSRQNPSIAPTSPLTCAVQSQSPLNYTCSASGDIQTQTSATCVCSPSPPTAPTVTSAQSYSVTVNATATGATSNATNPATATVVVQPVSANRGCTDDNSVPIWREIDFATTPGFLPWELYAPMSMASEGISNPPSVVAIRLKVTPGGGQWGNGSLQHAAGAGTSEADVVISRCRGRLDEGGRVHVIRLLSQSGSGAQSGLTNFIQWIVDPSSRPDAYTATLNAPGKIAADGWVSDGIYYANVRLTWCSSGAGGGCGRRIIGNGVPYP